MRPSLKHRCELLGIWALKIVANALPSRLAGVVGGFTGRMVGLAWRGRRRIAVANLQRAFAGFTPDQIERLVNDTFDNLGRTAFEILRFRRESPEAILARVDSDGDEPLAAAYRKGKGAIVMSGHFGNWEMFGAWVRARGYPVDFVVKPMRNPLVDAMYNAQRAALDVGIIHTQVATRGIVRALQEKRFVAILADQYAGEDGIEVEFFGRRVSTPRGPAALALRYGCPLLTGVLVRRPRRRFRAQIDGAIDYEPTGDHARDVFALTQEFTRRLENHIRQYPDQWLWTHRRWRD